MNVGSYLTNSAKLHPDRIAVGDGALKLTFRELNEHASAFSYGLQRLGLQPGDRVAIFMQNRTEYLVTLFGLFKGGFVAVPVNAKLHSNELAFIIDHSEASAVVSAGQNRTSVDIALEDLRSVHHIDVDVDSGPTSFVQLLKEREAEADFRDAEVLPDTAAWIFYTSGTTGRPKGAVLTHRNLMASTVNCLADMLDFQPEDVALHVAPLSHGSGLYALPAVARGTTNLIHAEGSFDPVVVLETMRREGVTIIPFLAPTMIQMMVEANSECDVSSFRRAAYGGAPIDPTLAKAAIKRFGRVFVQLYGQGEAPMTISRLRPEDHHGQWLHSVGTIRTNVEVRLVDEENRPVPDGWAGQVCVRGDVVMNGYLNDPDANAIALQDNWLRTGDIGRFENGFLYLLSRQNDVIISGGTNIYPLEVESALLEHSAISEACVFGEPDDKWGESVVAAVVASAYVTVEELRAFCQTRIASFKKPRRIEFLDKLPKNAYGKVLRRDVRASLVSAPQWD